MPQTKPFTLLLCSFGLLLVWAAAGAAPAVAQGRDPAAAEALFTEGRRLLAAKDYPAARAKFAESFRLDPTAGTLMNLAVCEEALGLLASAWQSWRAALDYLRPTEKERRALAAERAAALEPKVPKLTISLGPAANEKTEVRRDGVRLGAASLNVALPLDPGSHEIVVSQPGHEDGRYEVRLEPGQTRTARVEPGPARPAARETPSPRRETAGAAPEETNPLLTKAPVATVDRESGSMWGPSLLVGGLLVGAAAAASGYLAHQARQDAREDCREQMGSLFCLSSSKGALDRDRRFSLLADVGMGLGAVLAGTGLILMLSDGEGSTAAALTPEPGGARLAVSGRF